jgi:Protein of unknown function (DUF4038)/Domain of unknown function (DUF5060)/Putative collagen-binding domain of a collagenase
MARHDGSAISKIAYRFITISVLISFLMPLASWSIASTAMVPRWQPHDFTFPSKVGSKNPFQVDFSADVTGPDGIKLKVPGFYDGDGAWKVRVSPTVEGSWSIMTHSTATELDNQQNSFVCVANPSALIHGGLRVDPQHPHQFIVEDGTHFLPVGYECDWLWALDTNDPELKIVNPFLDKLTSFGFNFIILNAYAHDTTWRKGKTGDDDFGPPPLYAWEGTNAQPDQSRFNLTYWQHYDRVIEAMYQRGIVAHILMKVYNKQVNWPANGSAEDDLYFRWLIARYSAYPNVTWDLAKEANYEKDLNYKIGRLQFIRANDPYRRLLTVHDDHATYDRGVYNDLLDYRSDQQHTKWRATMLDHLQQKDWPVINTEFGYEHGPKGVEDKTYSVAQAPEEVCRRAWEIYMAGGFGVYYYTYTAWDVIRPLETPPGYTYCKHLREFFDGTAYWRMKPADNLSSDGYCLADEGREYVVFLNAAAPFTLTLQGLNGPLKAEWFQPFTGQRQEAGTLSNGMSQLSPPAQWGNGPVALHVGMAGE